MPVTNNQLFANPFLPPSSFGCSQGSSGVTTCNYQALSTRNFGTNPASWSTRSQISQSNQYIVNADHDGSLKYTTFAGIATDSRIKFDHLYILQAAEATYQEGMIGTIFRSDTNSYLFAGFNGEQTARSSTSSPLLNRASVFR